MKLPIYMFPENIQLEKNGWTKFKYNLRCKHNV